MGRAGRVVGTTHWRKCEVGQPSLPISQFLPIVRWSQPVQLVRDVRGQPHVRRASPITDATPIATTASSANSGSPTSPGPWPELRGSPPIGSGLGEAASAALAQTSHAITAAATAPHRLRQARHRHDTAPITAATPPDDDETEARRRGMPPRSAAGARSPSARTRIASSGSSVVRTSGRPRPADSCGSPGRVEARDAEHDRVLDRRDLLDPEADRGVGWRAGRDAVGDVGGGADRFAGHDHEPGVEGRVVDGDPVEAVADLELDALAAVLERDPAPIATHLEPGPAEDERPVRVVLELVLGVDPAADPDVAGRAAREAARLGDADRPASTRAAARPGSSARTCAARGRRRRARRSRRSTGRGGPGATRRR